MAFFLISVLFPPILHLSCDMGRPDLTWHYDDDRNRMLPGARATPPVYYVDGVCYDIHGYAIYEVNTISNSYYYLRVNILVIVLLSCFLYLSLAAMKKNFQVSVLYHRVLGSCPPYSSIL